MYRTKRLDFYAIDLEDWIWVVLLIFIGIRNS